MGIIEETRRAFAILNPGEKESQIDGLDWLFEKGEFKKADVGQAVSFMLLASLDERDEKVKETIFSVFKTAVAWNDMSEYIDWDLVIRQLSFLSLNGLIRVSLYFEHLLRNKNATFCSRFLEH